jgi:ribosomal protein S18 acetylase RimI-like enzyme
VIEEVATGDPRVLALRALMSDEMAALYGRPRHSVPGEAIDASSVVATVLVTEDDAPVATAALRRLGEDVEVKRMYVVPESRGRGLAGRLLSEMERRAVAHGAARVLLHTGLRQEAAIALYRRRGYEQIAVFEPYLDVPESICFARDLGADHPDGA